MPENTGPPPGQLCDDPNCVECLPHRPPTEQTEGYTSILRQYVQGIGETGGTINEVRLNNITGPVWEPSINPAEFFVDEVQEDLPLEEESDPLSPMFVCYWCGLVASYTDEEWPVCNAHTNRCEYVGCGAPIAFPQHLCQEHAGGIRDRCANCGTGIVCAESRNSEYHGGYVCDGCVPGTCAECGYETNYLENGYCEECQHLDPRNAPQEPSPDLQETVEDTDIEEEDLMILSIPGRENIRRCGIEIEGGGSWRSLGSELFNAGLTNHPELGSYHEQTSLGADARYWSLERDSSVDWELVSPPLNIADREHIRGLREVLQLLQRGIKSKEIWLDLRCGLHIHVGAEKAGIAHAWRLGVIWGFLEDLIFRLGAAKWPMHRAVTNGVHYCQPTPKGAKTKLAFGRQMDNEMDRYNALSFQNYIHSFTRNCQCGAVRYDSWDECTCRLGKCTFEFRVFNTSANMHKIHAYMALCQAMVAWATSEQEIDADKYDANAFVNMHYKDMRESQQTTHILGWQDGLSFIFNELPLTKGEKLDLIYCIENSEVNAVGEDFIRSLNTTTTEEVAIA